IVCEKKKKSASTVTSDPRNYGNHEQFEVF
ncbi:hypothetical protein X975_04220, partial [Stegodyphus mimosarum]